MGVLSRQMPAVYKPHIIIVVISKSAITAMILMVVCNKKLNSFKYHSQYRKYFNTSKRYIANRTCSL